MGPGGAEGPLEGGVSGLLEHQVAGEVVAYRATSGDQVWSAYVGTGVLAPPITYEIDGQQYVSIMAGWGGAFVPRYRSGGRLYTFSLNGATPVATRPTPEAVTALPFEANAASIARGRTLFQNQCSRCHNPGTSAPDPRRSAAGTYEALPGILKGALAGRGMPPFRLQDAEVADIRQFLLDERRKLAAER